MAEDNDFESAQGADLSPVRDNAHAQSDYLDAAQNACAAGDTLLGMHLYLAAYEKANQEGLPPTPETVEALRQAWHLAVSLKERSLAEYIFEKLEPFLSAREMGDFIDDLQRLSFDRLAQFGLSREQLEDMAEAISHDYYGASAGKPSVVRIEQFSFPVPTEAHETAVLDDASDDCLEGASEHDLMEAMGLIGGSADESQAPGAKDTASVHDEDNAATDDTSSVLEAVRETLAGVGQQSDERPREKYADLAGFESTIELMRRFGVGVKHDPAFEAFVNELNERHGLSRMPAIDSLLFRSAAREDANRFVTATEHELGLPILRLSFEESWQGAPMLVLSSEGVDFRSKQNFVKWGFSQPMTLVMEDVDLWQMPDFEAGDGLEPNPLAASAARGAREVVSAIRAAIESPNVFVLASAANVGDIDPFFMDLLEPVTVVDIELPTDAERRSVWAKLQAKHPSLGELPLDDVVRLSAGMPRYDIEMAANEAIEEAYKLGMVAQRYLPVSPQNLFEKLAAYQPLESSEYRELEQKVLEDFRDDLEHLDELLGE